MQRILPVLIICTLFVLTGCTVIPETPQVNIMPTSAAQLEAATMPACPTVKCPTCPAPITQIATEATPETQTPTVARTSTRTPKPTLTKTPAPTLTNTPTRTRVPTKTPTLAPYSVQANSPLFTRNFARSEKGCAWIGVAGQVFDKNGVAMTKLVVVVSGWYNGVLLNQIGMTGMTTGEPYGPGGFEIVIGTKPIATVNRLSIQVFDLAGVALTNPLQFSTVADCNKNLIIIDFKKR